MNSTETIAGTVTATTQTTVTVNGRRGTISRIKPVDVPPIGTSVIMELDPRDFIRSLVVTDGALVERTPEVLSDRDVRLHVLAAAAHFGASRSELKSADVLRIAEVWLAWIDGDAPRGDRPAIPA